MSKADVLRREMLYTTDIQRNENVAFKGAVNALAQSRPGIKKEIEQDVCAYLAFAVLKLNLN